ncbi:MAG TPA: MFS transporter [Candidatus Berkiella sp.]|nr:MFS transporter [Candidatus Berkiella sp.]
MIATQHQFQLFSLRRFFPYFCTQYLGALNDIFKASLLVLISMTFAHEYPDKANVLNNIAAAAFIFPFFLFAATAGQLADKYPKFRLIQIIKLAEVIIALLIGFGFYLDHFNFLLFVLFLLGTQAAFFSPVKYSILPQYLANEELTGGNGMVQMGTFVAILMGTILGGLLINLPVWGKWAISGTILFCALAGLVFSLLIPAPDYSPQNADLKINWEPFSQTYRTLTSAIKNPLLFAAMIGISWFWLLGSVLLTQIPNFTKLFLGGGPVVMTALLTLTSLGIGVGSLLCEKLSRHREEIGLVPFGAMGLTLFTVDLGFTPIIHGEFLHHWQHFRVLIDLFLVGLFGGFYIVPLYVMLQTRSPVEIRSQIIAANNILNSLFMTLASGLAIVLLKIGLTIPQLFLVTGVANAVLVAGLCHTHPEFITRFKWWLFSARQSKKS